jgi:hypothetical protein
MGFEFEHGPVDWMQKHPYPRDGLMGKRKIDDFHMFGWSSFCCRAPPACVSIPIEYTQSIQLISNSTLYTCT